MNTKDNEFNGSLNGNNGIKNNGSGKSARFTVRHRAGKAPLMMHDLTECTGEGDCIHEQGAHNTEKPVVPVATPVQAKTSGNSRRVAPVKTVKVATRTQRKSPSAKTVMNAAPMSGTTATGDAASTVDAASNVYTASNTDSTAAESKQSKPAAHLHLVKNVVSNNRKLFTGGFIATLVVGIIAGSTFGIGKALPANTDVVQFVTGMLTDGHAAQLSKQGKTSDAILEYEKAIQQSPNDLSAYKKLATIYEMDTREWTKATKLLKDALLINDSDADVYRLLAYAQLWTGANTDAAKSAQKAIDLSRDDAMATSTMALIVAAGGDLSKGKDLIQQSLNTDSNNSGVVANAALFYRVYAKDDNKAEDLIRRAIKISPENANNWWELSNILNVENKKDDAEQALRKALALQPDSASRTVDLASFLSSNEKKYDDAAILYRQAVSLGFDDVDTINSLAAALFNAGKYSDAAIEYQKTVDLESNSADHLLMLGRSQYQARNYSAAKDAFTKLVNIDQSYINYNWLGVACYAAGDYSVAATNFNRALHLNNEDATLWANFANATDKLGDTFHASTYALDGLFCDSNNETAWSAIDQIGNHMIKNNQRYEAKVLFTEAVAYQSSASGRSQVVTDLNQLS